MYSNFQENLQVLVGLMQKGFRFIKYFIDFERLPVAVFNIEQITLKITFVESKIPLNTYFILFLVFDV